MVLSPPYPCQLVLVMKLAAVLNDESGVTAEKLGVERQIGLQPLQTIDHQSTQQVERQHGQCILCPAHFLGGIDSAYAIERALKRPAHGVEHRRLALEDMCHVGAERLRQRQQDDDVDDQLEVPVGTHQNFSGKSSAITR
jgi:hypothetical protein